MRTIDKLLLGSANINKMKKEIDQVMRMLLGPLKDHEPFESFEIPGLGEAVWQVTWCPGDTPLVRYVEEWEEGEGMTVTRYETGRAVHSSDAKKVHEALDVFAEAMLKRFHLVIGFALMPVFEAVEAG